MVPSAGGATIGKTFLHGKFFKSFFFKNQIARYIEIFKEVLTTG
jgi:hypothetical protein